MSVRTIVKPEYGLLCDGCGASFEAPDTFASLGDNGNGLRSLAQEKGWKTRPVRGKGARTAPDLCAACAEAGGSR